MGPPQFPSLFVAFRKGSLAVARCRNPAAADSCIASRTRVRGVQNTFPHAPRARRARGGLGSQSHRSTGVPRPRDSTLQYRARVRHPRRRASRLDGRIVPASRHRDVHGRRMVFIAQGKTSCHPRRERLPMAQPVHRLSLQSRSTAPALGSGTRGRPHAAARISRLQLRGARLHHERLQTPKTVVREMSFFIELPFRFTASSRSAAIIAQFRFDAPETVNVHFNTSTCHRQTPRVVHSWNLTSNCLFKNSRRISSRIRRAYASFGVCA